MNQEEQAFSTVRLSARRERFAQLVAFGADWGEAYREAFVGTEYLGRKDCDQRLIDRAAARLMSIPDIVLRVAELRKPVMRKIEKKYEYSLNQALEQCDTMYKLAYEQMNVAAMGKAIELQSKLVKILSEQVEHRHGVLSDMTTDTLLAMRALIEDRKRKVISIEAGPTLEIEAVEGESRPEPSFDGA